MQPLVDRDAVLCLLLVFVIKVVGSDGIGHARRLLTQLSLFFVSFNGLVKNTHTHLNLTSYKVSMLIVPLVLHIIKLSTTDTVLFILVYVIIPRWK